MSLGHVDVLAAGAPVVAASCAAALPGEDECRGKTPTPGAGGADAVDAVGERAAGLVRQGEV